ncbi:hypothetical protein Tco_0337560 [Tanacetum coccineum]
MSTLQFADTHNLVAFLAKPVESEGFEQVVDFLNAHTIKYALIVNPTIYTSCIKQFWATVKVKTINGEQQLQALVDGKKIVITEASVRRDLQLDDEKGTDSVTALVLWEETNLLYGKKQSRRKQRKDTEIPQSSVPTEPIADEAANEENVPIQSNDQPLSKVNTLGKTTKTAQAKEIASLKKRVKKLERKRKSKPPGMKRLFKISRSAGMVSSKDEEVTLVDETQGSIDDAQMFDTDVFNGEEVFVVEQIEKVVEEVVSNVDKMYKKGVLELDGKNLLSRLQAKEDESSKIERGKAREPEELTDKEKARLLVELLEKRKKHFAALRAQEKRNKPLTKAQRKLQCQLISKKAGAEMAQESSSKRAGDELEQEKEKKQKIDDDQEEAEMKKLIKVVPDEEEVAIDAIPLATKPSSIIDWKIVKEGKIGLFQIIRANGSSKRYSSMIQMLRDFDREDLETLWNWVKAKHGSTRPKEGYKRVL